MTPSLCTGTDVISIATFDRVAGNAVKIEKFKMELADGKKKLKNSLPSSKTLIRDLQHWRREKEWPKMFHHQSPMLDGFV